jgi:outer membrane protein TolC
MSIRKALVLTLLAAGCGGGGAKYRVDDASLAQVSMQDKQPVFVAQTERDQAKAEQQKAQADLKQVSNDLDIAENDYKSNKLALDTAKLNQKNADLSGDVNRKNQASRDLHVAELGVKAADAKVDWLSRKRKWLKACADAAEEHWAAADSRLEYEKAKLAQSKGIRPSQDFNVINFETDNLKKQTKYSEARMDADKHRADVENLERQWQNHQQAYESAKSAAH